MQAVHTACDEYEGEHDDSEGQDEEEGEEHEAGEHQGEGEEDEGEDDDTEGGNEDDGIHTKEDDKDDVEEREEYDPIKRMFQRLRAREENKGSERRIARQVPRRVQVEKWKIPRDDQ